MTAAYMKTTQIQAPGVQYLSFHCSPANGNYYHFTVEEIVLGKQKNLPEVILLEGY